MKCTCGAQRPKINRFLCPELCRLRVARISAQVRNTQSVGGCRFQIPSYFYTLLNFSCCPSWSTHMASAAAEPNHITLQMCSLQDAGCKDIGCVGFCWGVWACCKASSEGAAVSGTTVVLTRGPGPLSTTPAKTPSSGNGG